MTTNDEPLGILLMTYGSPASLDDVQKYMTNVYGGRLPDLALVAEFKRRYALIGGSPLLRITREQAAALQNELTRRHPSGPPFRVAVGMRFFTPTIADGLNTLFADGARRVAGIIMSPQYSPTLMGGYHNAVEGLQLVRNQLLDVRIAGAWYREPLFQHALAQRIREALDSVPLTYRHEVHVLLSAHSMPKRVIDKEPNYIAQLRETAESVALLAGLARQRWGFCYQSAGHTPEEWLKPDFADVMPELATAGKHHVLIAPIQFLADHLEILYDIEIAARQQAEEHGMAFTRTASLNTAPLFIGALANIAEKELALIGQPAALAR